MGRKRKDVGGEEEEEEEGEEKKGEKRERRGRWPSSNDVGNKETHKMYENQPGVMKVYEGDDCVRIPMKALNSDFSCPVCLGIIKTAMVVTQCMHRFCEECISNSLRLGNKECPKCRAKCASKRHLRPDKAFDQLLLSIIKDVDKFEDEQLRIVHKVNASAKVTGNSALISEGITRQSKNRGKRLTKQDMEERVPAPAAVAPPTPTPPTKKRERRTKTQLPASEQLPFEIPQKKQKKAPPKAPPSLPEEGDKGPICWTYYQHNKTKDPIVVTKPVLTSSSPLITIYLQKHPFCHLPSLDRPWLTLSQSVKIEVLRNFVNQKYGNDDPLTFFLRSREGGREHGLARVEDTTAPISSLARPYDGPYITLFFSPK